MLADAAEQVMSAASNMQHLVLDPWQARFFLFARATDKPPEEWPSFSLRFCPSHCLKRVLYLLCRSKLRTR